MRRRVAEDGAVFGRRADEEIVHHHRRDGGDEPRRGGEQRLGDARRHHREIRRLRPGDADKAQKVVEAARGVMETYKDYHVALNDGFKIFLPNIPQKQYHFTNYRYGFGARGSFNPDHPTSLLYEKNGNRNGNGEDYRLVGVMYTAPKSFTEDDLNQRIPLSIAQWHEHVNFCRAPEGHKMENFGPNAKFGLKGSITTQSDCDAAGGQFLPIVFNWMVHLYPLEKDSALVWSVERQHAD